MWRWICTQRALCTVLQAQDTQLQMEKPKRRWKLLKTWFKKQFWEKKTRTYWLAIMDYRNTNVRQESATLRIRKHTGCCSWWCNQRTRPYWEHRLADLLMVRTENNRQSINNRYTQGLIPLTLSSTNGHNRHAATREALQARSKKTKACYDRKARDLPLGDKVFINPFQGWEWIDGRVVGRIDGRSYQVRRHDVVSLSWNRRHLRVWKGHQGTDDQQQWSKPSQEPAEDLA